MDRRSLLMTFVIVALLSLPGASGAAVSEPEPATSSQARPDSPAGRPSAWQRGEQALKNGALHEALLAFQEAALLAPESPDVHNNLGVCYARLRERDRAAEMFKKALELDPTHMQARRNLAKFAQDDGRFDEAIALLKPISQTSQDAGLLQDLGYLYVKVGDPPKATEALERAATLARTPELLYNLACLYSLAGRHDEAVELLHQAIGMDGRMAIAHDALGQAYELLGLVPQAKEAYVTARQLEPTNPRVLRHLVRLLIHDGDLNAARPLLDELLRLDPAGAEAQYYEALMLLYAGANDRAVSAFKRIVERRPDDAAAWNNLAVAYRRIGDADHADEALARAESLSKQSAAIRTNRGLAAAQAGHWDQARDSWSAAIALQPNFPPAVQNLELLKTMAPASSAEKADGR